MAKKAASAALLANAFILGSVLLIGLLRSLDPDLYQAILQEDALLEWQTFWAFVLAFVAGLWAAHLQRRASRRLPWFLLGAALLCLFVALEEISWGQRLFGYRPPVYFLEHNFQQELNLHNLVSTSLRKALLMTLIASYGIFLPLLAAHPRISVAFTRAAVVPAPLLLLPAFSAMLVLYLWYPWRLSAETVELMLGLGFLFSLLMHGMPDGRIALAAVLCGGLLVGGLGLGSAALAGGSGSPALVPTARAELQALAADIEAEAQERGGGLPGRCGSDKRLYAYAKKYRMKSLAEGALARASGAALGERARFLLDPWHTAYWIAEACSEAKGRRVVVYSFGPNRRRDSTGWEFRGDDLGQVVLRKPRQASPSASDAVAGP